ncbi:MAG: GNAT family N-acetyltransferase [Planctomycetota bacterium]
MTIARINEGDLPLLREFIASAGNSLQTFRYFAKRDFAVIKNHVVTLIGTTNGRPVAYGHLDRDGNDVWLGICIGEAARGQGLGKIMMARLLDIALDCNISELRLSVDENNVSARALYEKFGFALESINDTHAFYRWKEGEVMGRQPS